jgi:hypothetical protein
MSKSHPNDNYLRSISLPNPTEEHPKPARVKLGPSSLTTQTLQSDPTQAPKDSAPNGPFLPGYFFFYGPLMDPSTLAQVLQLPEAPDLRPARVIGYSVKMYGMYPALLWGPPENAVYGVACEILSLEQFDRVCGFEYGKFEASPCYIEFVGGDGESEEPIKGETFLWQGDHGELRDGGFDLEGWRRGVEGGL